jgi:hypothetical protein
LREIRTAFGEIEAEAAAEGPSVVAFASTMPDGSPAAAMAATAPSDGGGQRLVRSSEGAAAASPIAPTVATAAGVAAVSNTTLGNAASVIHKPATQPTRAWWAIAAGAVFVTAGAGLAWSTLSGGSHEPVPTQPATLTPAQPAPQLAEPRAPQPPPAVAPPATTSHVHIAATPANAKIRIDDEDVPDNPFDGAYPRDAIVHHIVIVAPGYKRQAEAVTFAKDQDLTYKLVAEPAPHRDSSAPPPPTSAPPTYTGKAKGNLIINAPDSR